MSYKDFIPIDSSLGELGSLWLLARQFGKVYLNTLDCGDYSCHITFNTIKHVELVAKSGFGNMSPAEAVRKALIKAEEITNELQETVRQIGKSTST